MRTLDIGIAGASGKFGRSVIAEAMADPAFSVVGGIGSNHSQNLGKDLGILAGKEKIGVCLTNDYAALFEKCDLVLDVSVIQNLENTLTFACRAKKPLIIGTTGHDEKNLLRMKHAAQTIPLFYAPNFSLGIAALMHAVSMISRMCDADYTIDETHHIHKKDSPSGTALRLAEVIKAACGKDPLAIRSERVGTTIGDHTVTFSLEDEQITLSHRAGSRSIFAKGALKAAKFLASQSPGFYSMDELLREEAYASCKN